jgi:hypothetical protein
MTQQPSKATHETLGRSSDLLNTWYANLKIFKARGTVPYKAIFCEDIPLHRPYNGLIYGRYLQFRLLKWPLIVGIFHEINPPAMGVAPFMEMAQDLLQQLAEPLPQGP